MPYDTLRLQLRRYFNLGCWLGLSSKCLGVTDIMLGVHCCRGEDDLPIYWCKMWGPGFCTGATWMMFGGGSSPSIQAIQAPRAPFRRCWYDPESWHQSIVVQEIQEQQAKAKFPVCSFSHIQVPIAITCFEWFHPWNTNHSGWTSRRWQALSTTNSTCKISAGHFGVMIASSVQCLVKSGSTVNTNGILIYILSVSWWYVLVLPSYLFIRAHPWSYLHSGTVTKPHGSKCMGDLWLED